MAEAYPESSITAVSNAHSQRHFIEAEAQARGLTNITVLTQDMNDFEAEGQFDRVVSIEMFEHMRNYQRLLDRVCRLAGVGRAVVLPYILPSQSAVLLRGRQRGRLDGEALLYGRVNAVVGSAETV